MQVSRTWPICLLAVLGFALNASAAMIELRDQAMIDADSAIRLKDIAQISDSNPERAAVLAEIVLGPAPAGNRTTRITFDDVRSRLAAQGINLVEIEFRGRQQTIVSTSATNTRQSLPRPPVTPSVTTSATSAARREAQSRDIQARLRKAFERAFRISPQAAANLRIDFAGDANALQPLVSVSPDQIRFAAAEIVVGQTIPLTVWWHDPQGLRQSVELAVTIQTRPQVLALKRPLPQGCIVSPDDLTWIPVEDAVSGLTQVRDVIGKEATRNLKPGLPLLTTDFASTPLVRTNDIVTVVVQRSGIAVRRPFKAASTGAMHDPVTLVALDDPRTRIQGIVTGFHEATLFGGNDTSNGVQDATGAIQFVGAPQPNAGAPR